MHIGVLKACPAVGQKATAVCADPEFPRVVSGTWHAWQPVLSMFIPVNGGQGMSRPFVVGLILLLVFLGMQSDLVPSKQPETEVTVEGNKKDSANERVRLQENLCLITAAAHAKDTNLHGYSLQTLPHADHSRTEQIKRKVGGDCNMLTSHASVNMRHNATNQNENAGFCRKNCISFNSSFY